MARFDFKKDFVVGFLLNFNLMFGWFVNVGSLNFYNKKRKKLEIMPVDNFRPFYHVKEICMYF